MSDDETHDGDTGLSPSDRALFGLADEPTGSTWIQHVARALSAAPALGRIDGYELLEEIGRGGQGAVFKARQPGTGRIVALKRFTGLTFSARDRERFAREIEALTRLGHPTVVTVHSAESHGEQPILVMEYVDGIPIDLWSDAPDGSRPSLERVLQVFAGVCDGVAHSHQHGVIHRDIKPSNVLVQSDGRPRLLDFGIAKLVDEWRLARAPEAGAEVTRTMFAGTPAFAAPEQLQSSDRASTLSDVYSLGALLYRILTGRPPFDGSGGLPQVIDLVLRGGPAPPSRVRAGISRDLDWIVLKAMDVDPDRRYQSVDGLATDVRRFLRGDAVLAHPPTALYRVRKWSRQHRATAASGVLGVTMLAGATGVSSVYYFRARDALADTTAALARETEALGTAKAAEAEASRQRELQAAVGKFLQDMLGSSNASQLSGRLDITVREVLDRASEGLTNGTTKYPPETEAAVRMSIGQTYLYIGLVDDAERHFSRALELRQSRFADSSSEVLESLTYVGRAYRNLGRFADAERIQRDVVAARRAGLGEPGSAIPLADALSSLGIALRFQKKLDEAVEVYTEAMEIYIREQGEVNNNTVGMAHNLQVVLGQQGKMNEAEVMARRALKMAQQVYKDKPHADLATMLFALGQVLWKRGNEAEGEPLMQQGLAMHRGLGGEIHGPSADAAITFAQCLSERGRWAEAEPMARSALAAYNALRPATSQVVKGAESALARALSGGARFAEAETLCAESIERGGDATALRSVYLEHGVALRGLERFADAQASLLRAWEAAGSSATTGPTELRRVADELAGLYERWDQAQPDQGYHAEAERWRAVALTPHNEAPR